MSYIKVSLNQAKELIKTRYLKRALDKDKPLRPLVLVGGAGIGKTAAVFQAAQELGVECRSWDLQFKESPEIIGLPHVVNGLLEYAAPKSFPQTGKGILFLDEFNRVNKDIRSGLLTLLQNRQIESAKLGKDWIMVGAMNPGNDENYETQALDAALQDRVAFVEIEPSHEDYIDYMTKKYGKEHLLVNLISTRPTFVDYGAKSRTTPRGLDYAASALLAYSLDGKSCSGAEKAIAAELGPEAAVVVMKYEQELASLDVTLKELLANYPKAKAKLDQMVSRGQNDRVLVLVKEAAAYFDKNYDKGEKIPEGFALFVGELPLEQFSAFMNQLESGLEEAESKKMIKTFGHFVDTYPCWKNKQQQVFESDPELVKQVKEAKLQAPVKGQK